MATKTKSGGILVLAAIIAVGIGIASAAKHSPRGDKTENKEPETSITMEVQFQPFPRADRSVRIDIFINETLRMSDAPAETGTQYTILARKGDVVRFSAFAQYGTFLRCIIYKGDNIAKQNKYEGKDQASNVHCIHTKTW